MQDEDCGFDWKTRANSSNSHWTKFRRLSSHFGTASQESLPWCPPTWTTYCMAIALKELKSWTLCCDNSRLVKKNTVSSGFAGKNSDKTKSLAFTSQSKTTFIERVQPITCDMKHNLTRKTTADEIHQLRSATQSLVLIARQTSPDLSYRISKNQSTFEKCLCSRHVRMQSYSTICNIYIHAWHLFFSGFFLAWCSRRDDQRRQFLPRTGAHRRRDSELQIITGLYHSLGSSDCESLFSHLISPNTMGVDNKRLVIDLSALKQLIWDNRDDCDEEVDGSKGDYPRWIDTSAIRTDWLNEDNDFWPIEWNDEYG